MDSKKQEIFLDAVKLRNESLIFELLAYYPWLAMSIDEDFSHASALHFAAEAGYKNIVTVLLWNGANVDALDDYHHTPLSFAVEGGHHATVQLLLEAGAQVNIKTRMNSPLTRGQTPLYEAVKYRYHLIVAQLLKAGAQVNLKDAEGNTPLFYSGTCRTTFIPKMLLTAGARIDVRNNKGRTVLHQAIKTIIPSADIIKLFIRWGAAWDCPDKKGYTPRQLLLKRHASSYSTFWNEKLMEQAITQFKNKLYIQIKNTYQLNKNVNDTIIAYFLRMHPLWQYWDAQARRGLANILNLCQHKKITSQFPFELQDLIVTHFIVMKMEKKYHISAPDGFTLIDKFFWQFKQKNFAETEVLHPSLLASPNNLYKESVATHLH